MNEEYTIVEDGIIKRNSDGAFIPADPNNGDYQKYLRDTGQDQ